MRSLSPVAKMKLYVRTVSQVLLKQAAGMPELRKPTPATTFIKENLHTSNTPSKEAPSQKSRIVALGKARPCN